MSDGRRVAEVFEIVRWRMVCAGNVQTKRTREPRRTGVRGGIQESVPHLPLRWNEKGFSQPGSLVAPRPPEERDGEEHDEPDAADDQGKKDQGGDDQHSTAREPVREDLEDGLDEPTRMLMIAMAMSCSASQEGEYAATKSKVKLDALRGFDANVDQAS